MTPIRVSMPTCNSLPHLGNRTTESTFFCGPIELEASWPGTLDFPVSMVGECVLGLVFLFLLSLDL